MATNLKKSKKVKAFCYRMITVGALITAMGAAVMGREALTDAYYYGIEVATGNIYDFPEFREYMGKLYNKAMVGYAGIGDDKGYPLTDAHARQYAAQAREDFAQMVKVLGEDIVYYIQLPETAEKKRNTTYPIFSEYDGHLLLPENVMLCSYWNGEKGELTFFDSMGNAENECNVVGNYYEAQYKPNREAAAEMKLVLAVKKDCTSSILSLMEDRAGKHQQVLVVFFCAVVLWFVFGVLSLFSYRAGRRAKEVFTEWSAKVLVEVKLILLACVVTALLHYKLLAFVATRAERMALYDGLWIYFPVSCLLYLLYTDIKYNGAGVFLNSIPVKLVREIAETVSKKSWYRRAKLLCDGTLLAGFVLIVCGGALLFLGMQDSGFLLACGVIMLITAAVLFGCHVGQKRLLRDTEAIVNKLSEMKDGSGNVSLVLSRNSLLAAAGEDLNALENGIERAVEQQNRSNKMRVELLTNVSHDLKTPLTSIINYADLLCEEELPGAAAEYATALQGKAYRLKNMVQDVFDLSKATSGNLKVESARLDLVKLIRQTLADMDERIQESDLSFRVNISTEPLMIEADGEKLYRVFQNLFVNAIQYSLEHSRVHIQLLEETGFAVARVKNTSRMELNFDSAEIMERFVRADSSRTTEGSGLGLSIVQSFVEACGGQFTIETDADMFTACVRFPLAVPTGPSENDSPIDIVLE